MLITKIWMHILSSSHYSIHNSSTSTMPGVARQGDPDVGRLQSSRQYLRVLLRGGGHRLPYCHPDPYYHHAGRSLEGKVLPHEALVGVDIVPGAGQLVPDRLLHSPHDGLQQIGRRARAIGVIPGGVPRTPFPSLHVDSGRKFLLATRRGKN